MIDHISVPVKHFEKSRDFYDQTLAILGFERVLNFEDETQQWAGYGREDRPSFGIYFRKDALNEGLGKITGLHVGFLAPSVEKIHQWYEKCLELGGMDNGTPGPRPEYYPGYYGAFILDSNGWQIETCCQNYQGGPST